jgi:hypothetical protein
MADLKSLTKDPIHSRSIKVNTHRIDDNAMIVEGRLRDDRLTETYSMMKGETMPVGVIHDMTIRLLVRDDSGMRIEQVEVELNHVPRHDCLMVHDSLDGLIGMEIAPGFSNTVRKQFGGSNGCAHLNSLLLSMASAAVQGWWTNKAGNPEALKKASVSLDRRFLIDTCMIWKKDGKLAKMAIKALEADNESIG